MAGPISPTPSTPHYFYSQIEHPDQPLPQDLQDHLSKIVDRLKQIVAEARETEPQAKVLTDSFGNFDQETSDFFTALSHNSNIGFQKGVKDKFDTMLHHFLDELEEIHPQGINKSEGTDSLRDMLSTYDPQKLTNFFNDMIHTSQGVDTLHHLSNCTGSFIQEITRGFHLSH